MLGLSLACNSSQKTVSEAAKPMADPVPYAETITEADLKEHLYTYASDEFEGRETGTPGQKKAVEYIKAHYQSLDVPPAKSNGDYFQKVPLEVSKVPVGSLSFNGQAFELGKEVVTFTSAQGTYNEIVYAGYGIEDGDYSDYSGIDVSGKLVLMKAGEPVDSDGNYVLSGTSEKSEWSKLSESISKKASIANDKGAKGVLYLDVQNFPRFRGYFDFIRTNDSGRMQLAGDTDNPMLLILDMPAAQTIKSDIEEDDVPKVVKADIDLNLTSGNDQIDSENVVAFIKGSEKPEEYVIISSHLDHIGVTADGQINNGADDDGSGTVALLFVK